MTTETGKAPTRAPLTLAELRAVSAIISPAQAGGLSPVFALVPLYAIRSAQPEIAVWAMPAVAAVSAMLDMLPEILTVEMQQAAGAASGDIDRLLSPQAMREKLISRLRIAA